jgi:hypothetical protein
MYRRWVDDGGGEVVTLVIVASDINGCSDAELHFLATLHWTRHSSFRPNCNLVSSACTTLNQYSSTHYSIYHH